jgi:hypothetical protein
MLPQMSGWMLLQRDRQELYAAALGYYLAYIKCDQLLYSQTNWDLLSMFLSFSCWDLDT